MTALPKACAALRIATEQFTGLLFRDDLAFVSTGIQCRLGIVLLHNCHKETRAGRAIGAARLSYLVLKDSMAGWGNSRHPLIFAG
ncbi:hypothetical protein [Pseudomonas sp. TCU-HL1]|uniref:hypothetical protein n=1 Tax=Pseudomonas sp. TCU-HL1 TaxID=1856685 RepID=UPI0011AB831B|nr:hypothetical protein [Pseudomonas sp. TCU-HL1]